MNNNLNNKSTTNIHSFTNAELALYATGRYRTAEAQREIQRRDRKHAKRAEKAKHAETVKAA